MIHVIIILIPGNQDMHLLGQSISGYFREGFL